MAPARTSTTHPLQIAEVRASPAHGRIGITFCPGKHDAAAATGAWARDLKTDLDAIAAWGARLVLTLVEPAELVSLKVPRLGDDIRARGMDWRHLPIRDFSIPDEAFEARWETDGRDIRARLKRGEDVLVHCKGGLGRAGLIAARLLVELGMGAEEAIRAVRHARKGAIETPGQLALVWRTRTIADDEAVETAAMLKVGPRLGSNPGGLYRDAGGRRFYVKRLESPAHALNERLAAKLYALAGAPTLTYVRTKDPSEVATVFVKLDKNRIANFTDSERAQARRWFGVHAWTANWDAAGFAGDNQGVAGGVALTLDLGGALEFRAQGDPKGRAFGATVRELDLMRTDEGNPHAVALFGRMSEDEMREAVAVVARLSDEAIRRVVAEGGGADALAEKMIARKGDMAKAMG